MLSPVHHSILQIFAILASQSDKTISQEAEYFLEIFLSDVLSDEQMKQAWMLYHQYREKYSAKTGKKGLSVNSVKFLKSVESIRETLNIEERHLLCLRTMEFVAEYASNKQENFDFVRLLADVFLIRPRVYQAMHEVVTGDIVHSRQLRSELLPDDLSVIFVSPEEIYFKNIGQAAKDANPELFVRMEYKRKINLSKGGFLIYSDILRAAESFVDSSQNLCISGLDFHGYGTRLFHGLNLEIQAPSLSAIMGQSGAGKSSLLRILAGILHPDKGSPLFYPENPLISFVPQEDSLNADLPAKMQLEQIALKFGVSTPQERANTLLAETGLYEKRNTAPGPPRDSALSGGERKRLNIAGGLVCQPDILLCDEPSSGLSFEDTESVIHFLRDAANKGCMVICTLHQPDAALMSYFDNMLYLDKGGQPVYFGKPDGFARHVFNTPEIQHSSPGKMQNVSLANTESFIRQTRPDEYGRPGRERKYPPEFWHRKYPVREIACPTKAGKEPGRKKISWLKHLRFLMAVLRKRPAFVSMFLAYAPVMAVLIASVCRYSESQEYVPEFNPHLPVFFVMSIVVALFSGLVFTLGELSSAAPERKREWVTERNNASFLSAQMAVFIPGGLLQAVLFGFIAVWILQLQFFFLPLTLMYFALYVFSAATGLLLSLLSRGRLWVYLLVPVLLIPQILFSGAMIPWEQFPGRTEDNTALPVSRIFAASWAYEGLITECLYQHPESEYRKEKVYYMSLFYLQDVLPAWREFCENDTTNQNCGKLLLDALPVEITAQIDSQHTSQPESLDRYVSNLFSLSLQGFEKPMPKSFPALWYPLQFTSNNVVDLKDGELVLHTYPYYRTGNLLSPKAAFVQVAGQKVRHFRLSFVMILIMAIIQYGILFIAGKKWPWLQKTSRVKRL